MIDFTKINFGRADAHTEGEEFPNLLTNGFVDIAQVIDKAVNTSTFLFLGYKGSGKSSLSEHLRLTQRNAVVDQQRLNDFPFKLFDKLAKGEDRMLRYKQIWRLLLLLEIFKNLMNDETAVSTTPDEVHKTKDALTKAGVFPIAKISDMVKTSANTKIRASVKFLQLSYSESQEELEVDVDMLIDNIKNLICSFKEEKPHIIVIDDLDDILEPQGKQFKNIAALINEVKDLNIFFSQNKIPVKILVLCRTDMFERLPDPNMNKIKQDKSFTFSWYREGIDTQEDSDLIRLINIRARLTYPEIEDVFKQYFPSEYENKPIYSALLDYTRHIPRDFVQLINCIQKYSGPNGVEVPAIMKGVKDYSNEYFKNEISNELVGYLPSLYIPEVFSVLSSMRNTEFSYTKFLSKCKKNYRLKAYGDVDEILRVLYDCSAIGQVYPYDMSRNRVTFKYRNQTSSFNPEDKIRLHKGLWKALNVNF